MARQARPKGSNNFSGGLITEATALAFPPNACTETFNCVFDETGRVTRRLGLDFEDGHALVTAPASDGEVFTEYLWQAVREEGAKTLLVQQRGNVLYFFETTNSVAVSPNLAAFTVNLDTYIAADSPRDPAVFQCQYASGIGNLLVVNPACDPISLAFNNATGVVDVTAIAVNHRDFDGVADGLDDNERVTSTLANLGATNPEHYYNLYNQGWYIGDALTQWDTARTDLPSNQDYVSLYRASDTDAFDTARVTAQSPGSTLASKGHFILTAWDLDRNAAMVAEGFTDGTIGASEALLGSAVGLNFTGIDDGISGAGDVNSVAQSSLVIGGIADRLFDGDSTATEAEAYVFPSGGVGLQYQVSNSGDAWRICAGKDLSSSPKQITRVVVFGTSNQGFFYNSLGDADNHSITLTLRAAQTAPTKDNAHTHGTSLGTTTFNDSENESAGREILSSDEDTFWNYVWVSFTASAVATTFLFAYLVELNFYTPAGAAEETYTIERPSCIEFFAGRAWYAGINTKGRGNKVYFSQIVEDPTFFGKCYQKNDPTAENFTDFLPTDGGVIRIPEMAHIKRLFAYQNSLLVFASNGVWQIQGSNNNAFIPTDFVVRRLSSVGTLSPMSFASFRGVPVWWGEDGIYTVKFDANYGSFEVTNITDKTIARFVKSIPEYNRQFVKSAYDIRNTTMYFLYNDSEDLTGNEYTYNGVLCSNGLTAAFYPWTIDTAETSPQLRGVIYVVDGSGVDDPVVKFTTTTPADDLTYSEQKSSTYTDWASDEDTEADYSSYFITGYSLDGDAQRFAQANYIWVYLEQEDNASCFMQGIFDFTVSGDSGKWSSKQQVFNPFLEHRSVNHRRLKVRGKGKAIQLKFTSEPGKPFTIIGWSIFESVNSGI